MRKLLAQPKVIVMRADHDVLVGLARQISGHVVDGLHGALHIDVLLDVRRPGKAKERGFRSLSISARDLVEILAGAREPAFGHFRFDLHERDAAVGRTGRLAECFAVGRPRRDGWRDR